MFNNLILTPVDKVVDKWRFPVDNFVDKMWISPEFELSTFYPQLIHRLIHRKK